MAAEQFFLKKIAKKVRKSLEVSKIGIIFAAAKVPKGLS